MVRNSGGFILSITTDYCYSNNVNYKVGLNQNITNYHSQAYLNRCQKQNMKTTIKNFEIKQIIEFDFNKEFINSQKSFKNNKKLKILITPLEQKEKKQLKF